MALNNWMSDLKDNIKLNQIVFPATHDSGMSFQSMAGALRNALNPLAWIAKGTSGIIAGIDDMASTRDHKFLHDNFVTQSTNVAGQLACGARQFDLRITRHNGTHRAYHGAAIQTIVGMRRYGEKWADICTGIAQFMAANPTEFIVLKMDKQKTGASGLAKALHIGWTKSTMRILVKALKKAGCTTTYPRILSKYIDQEQIGDLRGRVIVCGPKKTLSQWKKLIGGTPIELCFWQKDESGQHPGDAATAPQARISRHIPDAYPTYLLLGGAKAKGSDDDKRDNILDKQATMRNVFAGIVRGRKAGMRGIWFNTFSYLRDIRRYSAEIWKPENAGSREALWLSGKAIQNVASVDFLTPVIGQYVIDKNPDDNWQ